MLNHGGCLASPPTQPMSKIRCPGIKACRTRAPRKGPDLQPRRSRRLLPRPDPHISSGPTLQCQTVSRDPSKLLIEAITPRRRSLHHLFQPPPTRIDLRADHQIILSKKTDQLGIEPALELIHAVLGIFRTGFRRNHAPHVITTASRCPRSADACPL